MLPQMMPLPWFSIFFSVFFSFLMISFLVSMLHMSLVFSGDKMVKIKSLKVFW